MMFNSHPASCIANPTKGFSDWKHLNPRIPEHENSNEHRQHYLTWTEFKKRMQAGVTIDDELQKAIQSSQEKWYFILKIICDAVLFCAKNNLALRGSSEILGQPNCGVFLSTIELISRYNPVLKAHLENHRKGSVSYLSANTKRVYWPAWRFS